MTELITKNRVKFPTGKQRKFIQMLNQYFSIMELARLCNCSERTIRDWRREKFLMDYPSLLLLCEKAKTPLPSTIKLRDQFWYTSQGGIAGGKAIMAKYGIVGGDPEKRKGKWHEWWEKTGRFNPHAIIGVSSPIQKPQKSGTLAEFTGIMLGDGSISKRQVVITLNRKDDEEFAIYVANLIVNLFGVKPAMYDVIEKSVVNVVVSRSNLVKFCVEEIGLLIGNKVRQQVGIPLWIENNEKFKVACLRGLVDTDGCIFTHNYKVNGKWYKYKKLAFANRSRPLLNSVYNILQSLGLHPRLTNGYDVRLDSIHDVQRYFKIVGTNNPKHWKRYNNQSNLGVER